MVKTNHIKIKILMVLQLIFMLSWLTNMRKSDSYFFVYALTALAGTLCLSENSKQPDSTPVPWKIGMGLIAAVFSGLTALANYFLFEPFPALMTVFNLVCSLLGGWLVGYHILWCAGRNLPMKEAVPVDQNRKPSAVFLFSFLSVAVIDLVYLFFAAYPGILTSDSMSQMNQIHSGVFDNWHPYWHSWVIRIFVFLGRKLFGSYQAGVAVFSVFQILFLSASLAYAVMTLYQRRFPKWCLWMVWGCYALLPYHIVYSVTMWKDVFFGIACLLVITSLYRLITTEGKAKPVDMIVFFLGGVCFCIWRSNGLPAYLLLFAAMLIFRRSRKAVLAAMAAALVLGYLLTGPVLTALGVGGGNYVEALSIPLQQVARVISEGKELTQEEWALVQTVADEETIRREYQSEISDPIKDLVRASDAVQAIQEDPMPYLRLWVQLGLRYPMEYVEAWVEQTKGYWNGGYPYWIWTDDVYRNELGIYAACGSNIVKTLFDLYCRYFQLIPFLQPLISIGFHTWLVILAAWISLRNRRQEWILTIPILAIVASLVVSTPVFSEFRYIYSMFLCIPLILAVTCVQRQE